MGETLRVIMRKFADDFIVFIPEEFIIVQSWLPAKLSSIFADVNVHVPFFSRVYSHFLFLLEKLKWAVGFVIFPFWLFSKVRKVTLRSRPKESYQVGIRVYRTDLRFHYKYRNIDFLLDGKYLNKDNTLFCVETYISDSYRKELKNRNYNIVDLTRILSSVHISFLGKVIIKEILYFWVVLSKDILFAPDFVIKLTLKSLYNYLSWKRFLETYYIKHHVVYNDWGPLQIIRNIVFSRVSTKTWYYLHSCQFGDLYTDWDRRDSRDHDLLYLYYDNFVSWGGATVFLKKQLNHIKNFLHLGCLWSELTYLISKSQTLENLGIVEKDTFSNKIIIGVFDTSFGKSNPIKYEDMVLFIEGILRFLEDFPEVLVVFKEKNYRNEVNFDIVPYFKKIENHPRCFVPGSDTEPSEIVKISDLVIGACFTTPVVEALGAKRRAIYFDSNGRFKNCYYDRFPNLIAHSYDDLKKLISFWLYKVKSEEFDSYLETHIKKELNIFADGKAITRFRELLSRQ